MYSEWILVFFLGVLVFWLGVLSFFLWRQASFLESLFPESGQRDIRKKFEEILETVANFNGNLKELRDRLSKAQDQGGTHVQRVQLLRYNPYDDTGGDQSFSVTFLNAEGTGLVVTSLHSRAGTRVFAKPVLKGKPDGYNFSEEEAKVVEEAMG